VSAWVEYIEPGTDARALDLVDFQGMGKAYGAVRLDAVGRRIVEKK
jgi:hypothetical protein